MATVKCYVDGFNLYHALSDLGRPTLKWLNLRTVAEIMLKPGDTLGGVHYFTAVVHWDKEKALRHRAYIDALRAVGVCVSESHFKGNRKTCRKFARACPFYEEKQTDVALATQVLRDALSGASDRQLVITADTDHVPLFRHVRAAAPDTQLELIAPPGRLHLARELGALATWRRQLTEGQLMSCLFPRNVENEEGKIVARAPADYVEG